MQIGGPSGGCLTVDHLDLPLAYESLRSVGAMVGLGFLVGLRVGVRVTTGFLVDSGEMVDDEEGVFVTG